MEVTAKSYTLREESGAWLGQIVITSDGMFSGVTDWGNMCYAWRSYGDKDFRLFLIGMDTEYFGNKMFQGISNMTIDKKARKYCDHFAERILPALQKVLKEEMAFETQKRILFHIEMEDTSPNNADYIGKPVTVDGVKVGYVEHYNKQKGEAVLKFNDDAPKSILDLLTPDHKEFGFSVSFPRTDES